MDYIFKVLLLAEAALMIYASPTRPTTISKDNPDIEVARKYFNKYLTGVRVDNNVAAVGTSGDDRLDMDLQDNPNFQDNVITFQKWADLKLTGEVNKETLDKMEESRCGVPDPQDDPNGPGRYEVQSRWRSKKNRRTGLYVMTYTFLNKNTPDNLNFHQSRRGITLAMCQWELISNLRFRNTKIGNKKADIAISFEKGSHGDGFSFDGQGGTLGHAFYPEDGRVHLDSDEQWFLASPSNANRRKKDVFTAVLHEFGHTIGLLHSKDREAIMAPFYRYRGAFGTFDMPKDEIAGVEDMYGKRIASNPVTERGTACWLARRRYKVNITAPKLPSATAKPTEETFVEEPCEDDPFHAKTHCPAWKARKLCEIQIFASTMHKRCKKTCGFCPGSKKVKKASELNSNSICDVRSFDSFMTTYDEENGFSGILFKDDYYFKMEVATIPNKYSTHSLLNKTEDITGYYKFDTDPRSIAPGLFKIKTPNFLYRTDKADASVLVGKRYFTFQGKILHLYKKDITGFINFETSYKVSEIFYGFNESKVDAVHASVNQTDNTVTFTLFSGCNMWQYKEYRDAGGDNLLMTQIPDKSDVSILEWRGVAACDVDSVFDYRGIPYFLKGNVFWPATSAEPQVLRDITYNFFRCWENEPANITIPSGNGGIGRHISSSFAVLFAVFVNYFVIAYFS